MNADNTEICGFLDVKSGKRYTAQRLKKKTLVSSKIWKRVWCSMKKLEPGLGVQVQFNSKFSCSTLKQCENDNCVIIPSNAVIYRICSKTKQFAFGISSTGDKKPMLSLSANSETETQRWMADIRRLLKPRRYCSTGKYVSIVDNAHSKAAGLTGLHGDLVTSEKGISIRNIYTGETSKSFEWKEFSHFHLTTAGRPEDVKRICVIHTTREFQCGIGELHIFCLDANNLLQSLVTQGRGPKSKWKSMNLENIENLEMFPQCTKITDSCLHLKDNASHCTFNAKSNCLRTPICTETKENVYQSEPNILYNENKDPCSHTELNISAASGIYEEIVENVCSPQPRTIASNMYQNISKNLYNSQTEPPPLPPRRRQKEEQIEEPREILNVEKKQRIQIDNSSYVPMSPQMRNINVFESDIAEKSRDDSYVIMR